MNEPNVQINFDAPAVLRKWPSLKNGRISAADGGRPCSIFEGTLDDCIPQFMANPASQRHRRLGPLSKNVELARLPDFLLVAACLVKKELLGSYIRFGTFIFNRLCSLSKTDGGNRK